MGRFIGLSYILVRFTPALLDLTWHRNRAAVDFIHHRSGSFDRVKCSRTVRYRKESDDDHDNNHDDVDVDDNDDEKKRLEI